MTTPQDHWLFSEADAADLLRKVKDFRRDWVRSLGQYYAAFKDFRDDGKPLPPDFEQQLAVFENKRIEIVRYIIGTTKDIATPEWSPPQETSTLHDLETSLESLRNLCRSRERERRQRVEQQKQHLLSVKYLSSMSKEVTQELRKLQAETDELCHQLESATPSTEAQVCERIKAIQALCELVQAVTSEGASKKQLPLLEQRVRMFSQIEACFGKPLAIAALQGEIKLTPGYEKVIDNQDTARSSGVADLEEKFNRSHATAGPAKPLRTPRPVLRPTVSASEAEAKLKPQIESLRQLSAQTKASEPLEAHTPDSPVALRATGYDCLASISEHLLELLKAREESDKDLRQEIEEAVRLLAETQNAVRNEAESRHLPPPDEQTKIFHWLKSFVSEDAERIHVRKYMKLDEVANWKNNEELRQRIDRFIQKWRNENAAEKTLQHIQQLAGELSQQNFMTTMGRIDLFVRQYIESGHSPSEVRLREALLPAVELLPDPDLPTENDPELSDAMTAVLKHLHEYVIEQQQREAEAEAEAESDAENCVTPDVQRVRQWLRGKKMVLVAGTPKPEHAERIKREFELEDVNWIGASKSDRVSDLVSQIGDARVVVMVTKLMGHKHNDIRDYCAKHGIPCAQTKKNQGYGVNTLASVIAEQVSDQLDQAA